MSISVVTVVLDSGTDLSLTIESVRQQDYRDVELIVVDGGSRDTTSDVLALYDDMIDKIVRLEDAGIYHAMNAALDYCKNEYVLFLNAKDTLFTASTLRNLMECKRPDIDVFFGNHVYVQGRREFLKRAIAYEVSMNLLRQGTVDHTWLARLPGHQATFVRLELLRKLRFDPAVAICADHDLLVRAYQAGATFQYIDETVSHYIGGGFSGQNPSRLSLEWCAIYREQSLDPEAIDRFFLGDKSSPFGPQNAHTGDWVSGNYPLASAQPELGLRKPVAWCHPGVKLRAPARHASRGLRLEGYNPFENQRLTFFFDENVIGDFRLDRGWFRRDVKLGRLPPLALIEVAATRLGEVPLFPGRTVVFALAGFSFEPLQSGKRVAVAGDQISFSRANETQTASLLGAGWSEQEAELIWSIGETADLDLRIAPNVRKVILKCLGNPFITAPDQRGLDVLVNGRVAGRHLLLHDQDVALELDVDPPPADEHLTIRLCPLLRVAPPMDDRTLGVALTEIEFR